VQAVPPDARPLETVVNTEIAGIGRGYIAFNPSSVMRVGVSERIGVNLRKAFTQDLLDAVKRDLTSGLKGRGTPEFQQLDVGDIMVVRLDGLGAFGVQTITPERQPLLNDRITRWEWDVIPKEAGNHSLILCVDIALDVQGHGEVPISNCSFERVIQVKVNPAFQLESFLANHWQWILGTPFVSAGLGWIAHRGWKRKRQRSPRRNAQTRGGR
jgi:hypothetical protein